jgi:cytochrome c oxidase assembly protein subunit 15
MPATLYGWSVRAAAALALLVVVLGATVRLADAGLGCPDWPGCYGKLTVSAAVANADTVQARWPDRPLHAPRAHLEMFHRYAAGTLGLLILGVAVSAWRARRARLTASVLLGLVVFQALLGMWTVTLSLAPLVVTAHLLGGMGVLALLWWLVLDDSAADPRPALPPAGLRPLALLGLGLLAVQIGLGGWTAANHAALVCQGFPTCNGDWWPPAGLAAGFGLGLPGSIDLIAIHWAHRLGALAVLLVLGTLVIAGTRAGTRARPAVRRAGLVVGALLIVQIALGIANVLTGLPLPLAAAHNAVAALLLLAVLTLNHQLTRRLASTRAAPIIPNHQESTYERA